MRFEKGPSFKRFLYFFTHSAIISTIVIKINGVVKILLEKIFVPFWASQLFRSPRVIIVTNAFVAHLFVKMIIQGLYPCFDIICRNSC